MNYIFKLLAVFIFTISIHAQSPIPKINIAVNNLLGNELPVSITGIITDRLRSELVNTGIFRVMDPDEMETILNSKNFKKTGYCNNATCLVSMGKVLGVDHMVAGSVGKIDNFFSISLRIIDVKSGEILFVINEDFEGTVKRVITEIIGNVAQKMASKAGSKIHDNFFKDKKGDLFIETEIPGAIVEINGNKNLGITPLTLRNYPAGKLQIVVQKDDYYGVKNITLMPEDLLKMIIPMEKGSGILKIFTDVVGADVYLDGENVGQTPLKVDDIPAGMHAIHLEKENYLVFQKRLLIKNNETKNMSVMLKKAGMLDFNVKPSNALIYVDGRIVQPEFRINYIVPARYVTVIIQAPGYERFKKEINVSMGGLKKINVSLVSKYGSVKITSVQENCDVYFNDEKVGTTPYSNFRIVPGNYMLKVQKDTYSASCNHFTVKKNVFTKKHIDLNLSETRLKTMFTKNMLVKKKIQWGRRFGFGGLSLITGIASIVMHSKSRKELDNYISTVEINGIKNTNNFNNAKKYRSYRNALVVASLGLGTGCGISIRF